MKKSTEFVKNIGLQWLTKINRNHFLEIIWLLGLGSIPGMGNFFFYFFYLIWLSLSSESSQFKNFAKILKTLWENNIFNKKHVIIKKNYSIFRRNFWTGMILSSSWVKLNNKSKKKICHPGDRTQAKTSNDFQKMISVDFGQPLQPYGSEIVRTCKITFRKKFKSLPVS